MINILKRWNESYWCPTCRKNVWDTDETVTDMMEHIVMERNEVCPDCGHVFNTWNTGYLYHPETKILRMRQELAMWWSANLGGGA